MEHLASRLAAAAVLTGDVPDQRRAGPATCRTSDVPDQRRAGPATCWTSDVLDQRRAGPGLAGPATCWTGTCWTSDVLDRNLLDRIDEIAPPGTTLDPAGDGWVGPSPKPAARCRPA